MFLKLFVLSIAAWQVSAMNGGTNAPVGQFPSFVAIFLQTPPTFCGGAIINSNHVLTLASCMLMRNTFTLRPTNQVSVMFGHNQIDASRQRLGTQAIYVNTQFSPFTLENDIAVIRTSSHFLFPEVASPNVAPGILSDRIAFDTQQCNLAAWNQNNNQQQTLLVPIFNLDDCNRLPLNFGRIPETAFCAGLTTAGAGVCDHNIGGILYCNGMVHGLLNSGFGCGAAQNPGIYVSVRHHNAWIQEQLRRQDIPVGGTFPLERLP